jgi:hypothetical protein
MSKIYIVEANFDSYESSWSYAIGVFTEESIANKTKDKWNSFYKENLSVYDGLDSSSEDEEIVNKYYEIDSKYGEIKNFRNATVTELELNRDIYSETDIMRTDPMIRLITEWERDHKLKEILE